MDGEKVGFGGGAPFGGVETQKKENRLKTCFSWPKTKRVPRSVFGEGPKINKNGTRKTFVSLGRERDGIHHSRTEPNRPLKRSISIPTSSPHPPILYFSLF